jgi:hypothetical protein
MDGRYDLSRDSSLDGELRLGLTTMTAGSLGLGPNVAFGPSGMPLTATYGETIGADQKLGHLDLWRTARSTAPSTKTRPSATA